MRLNLPFCTLALMLAMLCPQHTWADNGAIAAAYPLNAITVDGDLSDWPADMKVYQVTCAECGLAPRDDQDLTGKFRVGYSTEQQALYVAVEVTDDTKVTDPNAGHAWNTQDGCSIYLDRRHVKNGIQVEQYFQCGDELRFHGVAKQGNAEVKMSESPGKRVYEWKLPLGELAAAGTTLGFDIDVTDKDNDGSFTWMAFGTGTQKVHYQGRVGHLHLLAEGEALELGRVHGQARLNDSARAERKRLALVSIQSTTTPSRWTVVPCTNSGSYTAQLPAGSYTVSAVDSADLRVSEADQVHVQIDADQNTQADLLVVSELRDPDLIGDTGILHEESFEPAAVDRFVNAYRQYYRIPGLSVAVIKDGQIRYHQHYGVKHAVSREPIDANTVFEACSLTKPIFAFAVNRLVDKNVINLEQPLSAYLPNAPGYEDVHGEPFFQQITALHVLTHRTGFPNWRSGKLTIDFEPGTSYGYSGEGFELLGTVVSHLTGKDLAEVLQEEVFSPLAMENTHLVASEVLSQRTANGHVYGTSPVPKSQTHHPAMAFSLHTNAQNYAKLLTAILSRNGLAEATFAEMLRPQFASNASRHPDERPYGLGVVVNDTPFGKRYSHEGVNTGWRCQFGVYDNAKAGYVVFTNSDYGHLFGQDLERYLVTGKSGS